MAAFENYVHTFNADSFILGTSGGDASKALSWIVDARYKRLYITNEMTVDGDKKVLNGNLIKKICSGGDKILARKNYQDEQEFRLQGRLFMCLNDMAPIEPPDALQTVTIIKTPYSYEPEPNPDIPWHRKADSSIKEFVKRADVRDALIHIVIGQYTTSPVVKSVSVKQETDELLADSKDINVLIKKDWKFTKCTEDKVKAADIKTWATSVGVKASTQKLKDVFVGFGAKYEAQMKIKGTNTTGYRGIIRVEATNDGDTE
jgi:hypothetical protein